MKKILWKLLEMLDNNHGYSTPLQKRFKCGDECVITRFKLKTTIFQVGDNVKILETGRHDYLVVRNDGLKAIVYQFELMPSL